MFSRLEIDVLLSMNRALKSSFVERRKSSVATEFLNRVRTVIHTRRLAPYSVRCGNEFSSPIVNVNCVISFLQIPLLQMVQNRCADRLYKSRLASNVNPTLGNLLEQLRGGGVLRFRL